MVKREGNRHLRATMVWVPVLGGDTRSSAEMQARLLQTDQVAHVWDENQEIGACFARSLALAGPGWDLYLLHAPGVRWERALPPAPTFWMHQLARDVGADPTLYLGNNPQLLGQALHDLLTSSL